MHCTVRLTLLCLWLPVAVGQREWSPWQSPWWNFENRYLRAPKTILSKIQFSSTKVLVNVIPVAVCVRVFGLKNVLLCCKELNVFALFCSVVARTYYGDVKGYSIPFHVEDEYSSPEWDERPRFVFVFTKSFLCLDREQNLYTHKIHSLPADGTQGESTCSWGFRTQNLQLGNSDFL